MSLMVDKFRMTGETSFQVHGLLDVISLLIYVNVRMIVPVHNWCKQSNQTNVLPLTSFMVDFGGH